ncbi:MAG: hypothetical protein J0H87_08310 [Holosporales bacterium]|nr:hypothetical protein [Holosporales bacterium]
MLLFSLQRLSDKEYQSENWVDPNYLHSFWDTFLFDLEFLYDDLVIYEHPEDGIGYVLLNQEEADILRPLYNALDDVCEKIGEKQPDSSYINSPLWDKVIRAAEGAFKIFIKNEEEAKKVNPHPWRGEEDWGKS